MICVKPRRLTEKRKVEPMKTILCILAYLLASTTLASAQFRLVNGKIYSITDEHAGWTALRDPMRVRGFSDNDIICETYREITIHDEPYWIANHQFVPTHTERIYGQHIVLRNYPLISGLNLGDTVNPPIYAMRVSEAAITSGQRDTWRSAYNSSYGSSSGVTTFGEEQTVLVFDLGTPYTPPLKALTPDEIKATARKRSQQDGKTFRWLQSQATNGSVSAQCSLGRYYLAGCGTETNIEMGLLWLRKARDSGDFEASNILLRLENPVTNAIPEN